MNNKQRLLCAIKENNGYIYTKQLKQYGLHQQFLHQLKNEGQIEKIARGIYALKDRNINDFFVFGAKYKSGIFSHNTALYFYDMTERTPITYDMTFPSNVRIKNEYIKSHYVKKDLHTMGLIIMPLNDNTNIRIYDMERTICDIVRDRNKIDTQILNTALNSYIHKKEKNLFKLYEYAQKFRIEKILTQYLEVLDK